MAPKKSAFIFDDVTGREVAVDQVRFAIGSRSAGLLSSEWMATSSAASGDIFLASRGLHKDIKVTFHSQHAIVAIVADRAEAHREKGWLARGESRQRTVVKVQAEGAWEAAHINFVYGTLRPIDRALPLRRNKRITLIAPPIPGHLTRIFVIHSFDQPGKLSLGDVQLEPIAGVQTGNRFLRFFAADMPIDVDAEHQKLRSHVRHLPDFEGAREIARAGNLAAVFWGNDGDRLNFIEVHNIVEQTQTASSPASPWRRCFEKLRSAFR